MIHQRNRCRYHRGGAIAEWGDEEILTGWAVALLARLGKLLRGWNSSCHLASGCGCFSLLEVGHPAMISSLTVDVAVITLVKSRDTLPYTWHPFPPMPAPGLVWDLASMVNTMVIAEDMELQRPTVVWPLPRGVG